MSAPAEKWPPAPSTMTTSAVARPARRAGFGQGAPGRAVERVAPRRGVEADARKRAVEDELEIAHVGTRRSFTKDRQAFDAKAALEQNRLDALCRRRRERTRPLSPRAGRRQIGRASCR